jgi:ATP-dependent Zn protease
VIDAEVQRFVTEQYERAQALLKEQQLVRTEKP